MKAKKSRLKLKQVLEYLNDIPRINHGGCGVSALATYRWLEQNYGNRDIEIIYCYKYYNKDRYDNNEKALRLDKVNPSVPVHVVLKYKKFIFDSEGIVNSQFDSKSSFGAKWNFYHKVKDVKFLLRTINEGEDWNSDFRRDCKVINKIQKKLNIKINDVVALDE